MFDRYNRNINYLRISVTDRCNLRCTYCMPEEGMDLLKHHDILTFEEIVEVVNIAVDLGIEKVRITGGEPLVRKGIVELVRMIAQVEGIHDLSMTSNGILLKDFAHQLFNAGLQRINISMDTVNPSKYKELTRGGDINNVLHGLVAAKTAGLDPIKINCVIRDSLDEKDAMEVKKYAMKNALQIRFIRQMDLKTGKFSVVEGGEGGKCSSCNRLRLTANGKIRPCLFNDIEFDVRKLGAEKAMMMALGVKPKSGTTSIRGSFYGIGG